MSAENARCSCDLVPMSCGGEGPSETCEIHGRPYAEWVERGDILAARLEAVKEVIAKVRRTPATNDPFRVALDIADDLEAAVYLEPGTCWPPDCKVIDDLRAALRGGRCPSGWCGPWKGGKCVDCGTPRRLGDPPTVPVQPTECCASGRCEVCSPGLDWGRDG